MSNDAKIITAMGGPTKAAVKLGFGAKARCRVGNWLKRGIPAQVWKDHYKLLKRIEKAVLAAEK